MKNGSMKKCELMNAHVWLKGLRETHRDNPSLEAGLDALLHLATVVDIISSVEDEVGHPGLPCPVQSQTCVQKLRQLLGISAWTRKRPAVKAAAAKPAPLTCGKGPYRAGIVPTVGGDPVWVSERTYRTEKQAFSAIIRKAKILKHRLSGYTRGWVTEKNEYMIDYGSYTYYGRVTSITK